MGLVHCSLGTFWAVHLPERTCVAAIAGYFMDSTAFYNGALICTRTQVRTEVLKTDKIQTLHFEIL